MFGRDQFYKASSEQAGLRLPKSLPKCMDAVPPATRAAASKAQKVADEVKGTRDSAPKQQPKCGQRYIPGLNSADDPSVVVPANAATKRHLPGEVPVNLVDDYLSGAKHAISSLMEYSTIVKIVISFEEVRVERPSIVAKFANRVKVNGKPFPQGTGKTKKEAKTAAAKIAMDMLLGVGDVDFENEDDTGSVSKASILTNTTFEPQVDLPSVEAAGVRPLWDPPKHPVSRFTEYCSTNLLDISWKVSDRPTEIGFKAEVHVNDGLVAEAYALNKKDAKKKAAQLAIEKMCPQHLSSVENAVFTKPSRPLPSSAAASAPQAVGGAPLSMPTYTGSLPGDPSADYPKVLREFCKTRGIQMHIEDSASNESYEANVYINDQAIVSARGRTQAEARNKAAEEALQYLSKRDPTEGPHGKQSLQNLSFHDGIAAQAHQMLETLLAPTGESLALHKYLAAFIVRRGEKDQGQVVALGTGNMCIPAASRSPDGRILNDCHFVTMARRALLKYIHRELKMYFEGNLVHSIFEPLPGTALLTFKEGVTIHLYMSRAPSGDASLYHSGSDDPLTPADLELMEQGMHYPSFPDDNAGYTSVKHEKGFDVTLANEQAPALGDMSCSDKILKWNTVGLQGALFGNFLAPLYLSSITLGSMFDHGNLSRAVCCRLTDDIAEYLPPGFQVNHPYIGRVTTCAAGSAHSAVCAESLNWSFGDEKIEIVSGHTGKSCERSPFRTSVHGASRLCKAGFLFRFREVARLAHRADLVEQATYSSCKAASHAYQQAKHTLAEHLSVTGFGYWVSKPPGLELFTK